MSRADVWVPVLLSVAAVLALPALITWSLNAAYRRAMRKHHTRIAQQVWDNHHKKEGPE